MPINWRSIVRAGFVVCVLCGVFAFNTPTVAAQQPFVTDDTDVTAKRKVHIEVSNQFDILQRSSFPGLRLNTADFAMDYGLVDNLEISIQSFFITLINAREANPRIINGAGETNLSMKYNFYKERTGSSMPAMSVSANLKLPTGDEDRQLGTGLVDYLANLIVQKSLSETTTLRFNGGFVFTGSKALDPDRRSLRAGLYTGGISLVKAFTDKLKLGVEMTGAASRNRQLSRGQLQVQIGGNYSIGKTSTFDFGVIAGRFPASPRIGAQLGFSFDLY